MGVFSKSTIVTDPVTGQSIPFGDLTRDAQQTILDINQQAVIASLYGATAIVNPPPVAPPVIATATQTSTLTTTTVTTVTDGGSRTVTNFNTTTKTDTAVVVDTTTELDQAKQQFNTATAATTNATEAVQIATDALDGADRGSAAYLEAQAQLDEANATLNQATAEEEAARVAVEEADAAENSWSELQEPEPTWDESSTGLNISSDDEADPEENPDEATLLNSEGGDTTDIPGEINWGAAVSKGVDLVKNLAGGAVSSLGRLASVGLGAGGKLGSGKSALDTAGSQAGSLDFDTDWRVRLTLPPGLANTIYKDNPLLAPLSFENRGVIFPYTPNITVSYTAEWQPQKLTHSNYASQNYNGSEVQDIQIQGTFTAQNQAEAEYLLAVLTFGKLVTKMFFGNSEHAGNPPPILHLYGHGTYQWNRVPVVVKNFQYTLSPDVDYIPVAKQQNTRVPATIESMSWTVAPVYSRQQMAKFSYQQFADGSLIKGGFI